MSCEQFVSNYLCHNTKQSLTSGHNVTFLCIFCQVSPLSEAKRVEMGGVGEIVRQIFCQMNIVKFVDC